MQNGICEVFNRRTRDELLNKPLYLGLDHARSAVARGVADYSHTRPVQPRVIGSAHPTRCAARPLLPLRSRAHLNLGLRLRLGEYRGPKQFASREP